MRTLTEEQAIDLIEYATEGRPFTIIEMTKYVASEDEEFWGVRRECHTFVQSFPSPKGSVTISGVFPDEGIVDLQIEAPEE